ncbi:phosphate ABC transporter permease PstA [Limosilactobacillus mucosae]|uniref:Phosphate transport system permease protein PstA n=1 Tax=Limosilactobacillus mucosae TaxID=97478 RepID=A0AAJ1HRV6_LIMMU|nr:phosphate ABC transporter permease PstA [Limosilactobacillus mucosae]MDC2827490.1 phosphate ABC transporter permease PstA [Limosilactobacillus mucosae]MDC2835157.1 phosphate ABC transporter permease PstA [Limosilactobacillus mucosae]
MLNAKKANQLAMGIIYVLVGLVVLILFGLLGYIILSGLPHISWKFLSSAAQSVGEGGGIRDQLFNSLYLLVLTLLISTPLSIGAGIFLAEYAPKNGITEVFKTAIEILSSLPSVVVGLFGYLFFVIKLHLGFSVISGAIALTFFNLPLLTRNCENALNDVSPLQRQAGLSLGLSRWKTMTKIMLPEALPGILTGVILGAGRVFGEAAALIYTSGQSAPSVDYGNWNPFSATSFLNPTRPAETLAVHIWKLNTEGLVSNAHAISSGASAVLIIVILLFNLGARYLGNHVYKKMSARK